MMSPLQFFARVCGLVAAVVMISLALYGCGSGSIPGGGDSSETNYDYTTINCTQSITVQMTRAEYDESVAAGEPIEEISVDEQIPDLSDPNQTVTATQCLNVGNESEG